MGTNMLGIAIAAMKMDMKKMVVMMMMEMLRKCLNH